MMDKGSCIGVRSKMRREGKEVQSFFFLVNEHISPGARRGGGVRDV